MQDFPWRIASLVAGLLVLALLLFWSLASSTRVPDAPAPEAVTQEVWPPPADVRRDPRAAQLYVESETCRAACNAEDRTCRAMALDEPERVAACASALEACEARCR